MSNVTCSWAQKIGCTAQLCSLTSSVMILPERCANSSLIDFGKCHKRLCHIMEFIVGRQSHAPIVFLDKYTESIIKILMKSLMFTGSVMTGMVIHGDLAKEV